MLKKNDSGETIDVDIPSIIKTLEDEKKEIEETIESWKRKIKK